MSLLKIVFQTLPLSQRSSLEKSGYRKICAGYGRGALGMLKGSRGEGIGGGAEGSFCDMMLCNYEKHTDYSVSVYCGRAV